MQEPVDEFIIKDNQGNEFEPEPQPEENRFAYTPRELEPKECIPESGSVAQQGPTGGAMLLFRLPLQFTENRPIELEIEGEATRSSRSSSISRTEPVPAQIPASRTTRAAGAAVAPPDPARTNITPTAILGSATGA